MVQRRGALPDASDLEDDSRRRVFPVLPRRTS